MARCERITSYGFTGCHVDFPIAKKTFQTKAIGQRSKRTRRWLLQRQLQVYLVNTVHNWSSKRPLSRSTKVKRVHPQWILSARHCCDLCAPGSSVAPCQVDGTVPGVPVLMCCTADTWQTPVHQETQVMGEPGFVSPRHVVHHCFVGPRILFCDNATQLDAACVRLLQPSDRTEFGQCWFAVIVIFVFTGQCPDPSVNPQTAETMDE